VAVNTWAGREAAERLRQWSTIAHVASRVGEAPALEGLILIGSFAAGHADEFSDVDSIVVVSEGRFAEAWGRRADLQTPDALFAWDVFPDPTREVGGHKWLTRDVVKVECLFATASSGVRLAEPFAAVVGEDTLGESFRRVPPIPRAELEDFAQRLREEGKVPSVETLYGELMRALRDTESSTSWPT
jgi:hypothetical protein